MTSVMINQDLDSSVLKALRLLHSSDSDSEDQLRLLWKQSIIEKYGNSRVPTSVLHKIKFPSSLKRSKEGNDVDAVGSKKVKLEPSLSSKSTVPSHSHGSSSVRTKEFDLNSSDSDADSDRSGNSVEVYSGDGLCVKCKTSFSSTNNKLIECVDCQKHYHQDCHFPPITDMDLNDPRLVWYCSGCEEKISTNHLNDKIKTLEFSSPNKTYSPLKGSRTYGNSAHKSGVSSSTLHSKSDSSLKHASTSSKKLSSKKIEKIKSIK